jgi:hypothetical protein
MARDDSENSSNTISHEDVGTLEAISATDGHQTGNTKNQSEIKSFSRPTIRINNLLQRERLKEKSSRDSRTTIDPFGLADLTIDPLEVLPEDTVTISFKATNNSDVFSMYAISLKINREVVAAEVMKLPPGVSVPMYFTVTRNLPGDYMVKVNHLTGKFIVKGNKPESPLEELEVTKADVSDSNARFELGLSEVDAYLQQRQSLNEKTAESVVGVQSSVDKVANMIEIGLDKIGDGLTFPIEKLVDISTKLLKVIRGNKVK